jgi:hypothetical protein
MPIGVDDVMRCDDDDVVSCCSLAPSLQISQQARLISRLGKSVSNSYRTTQMKKFSIRTCLLLKLN